MGQIEQFQRRTKTIADLRKEDIWKPRCKGKFHGKRSITKRGATEERTREGRKKGSGRGTNKI